MQRSESGAYGAIQMETHTQIDTPVPVRPERCPVEDWLAFLGHRWNALVLWHLQQQPLQHRELLARLPGVTPKVLAARLKALSGRGLVEREAIAGFPPTVVYRLSPRGLRVIAILDQLELLAKVAAQEDGNLDGRLRGALFPAAPRV